MTLEGKLWTASIILLAAFAILATLVMTTHAMSRFDAAFSGLRGHATWLAAILTLSGRAASLIGLSLITVLVFIVLRKPLWIPAAIIASQLASQAVVELIIKPILARPRPSDWLITRDLGFSFPSGHSTTAIVFFGAWLLVVWLAPMDRPLKFTLAALLVLWIIGIDWSRIALSAHYASDVLGGTLLGSAWLTALLALAIQLRFPLTLTRL